MQETITVVYDGSILKLLVCTVVNIVHAHGSVIKKQLLMYHMQSITKIDGGPGGFYIVG